MPAGSSSFMTGCVVERVDCCCPGIAPGPASLSYDRVRPFASQSERPMCMNAADVFTTLDVELKPDPSRTVIRPFSFGYPSAFEAGRPPRSQKADG